jgi:hypothetical protein
VEGVHAHAQVEGVFARGFGDVLRWFYH